MSFMPEELTSIKQLTDSPQHFINELIQSHCGSYLLYNLCPMMLRSDYVKIFDLKYKDIKYPILQFLTNIAILKYTVEASSKVTYKQAKEKIIEVIHRDFTPYRSYTSNIGHSMLDGIKEKQYEERSLESAILTCAPIVQYAKTAIVKPEMTKEYREMFVKKEIPDLPDKKTLDNLINDYLVKYPIEIITNGESFINPSDPTSGLINLNYMTSPESKVAAVYFLLVYLRWCCGFRDWKSILSKVFNLNTVCNKIGNGERISIEKAIEAFTEIPCQEFKCEK